ncbi:MAG TPA: hypothetical protein VFQ95_05025 [Rhodanobacteraceae bacterium]|nr:hypothetical protein [Rhodanobacteraceae bacterium]
MRRQSAASPLLPIAIACALGLPLVANAAPQATGAGSRAARASTSARETALEARVNQLEQELNELKAEIQAQAQVQRAAAAAPPPPAPAPAVAAAPEKPVFSTGPGLAVQLHGFISASAFSQNRAMTFGNGQNAEFPVPGARGSMSGVDVRNTRFWLDFSGAQFAGDWTGGGRIEMDFFGGFNGTGAYSQQQPTPRLRQAYLDLDKASTGTLIRIGQQWELMFPLDDVPASLSHVAFPLGFGTGMIGWRFPGIVLMQDLNHGTSGVKWRLDLGAFEGSWSGPGDNVNFMTAGNAGFRPQLEARLRAQGSNWVAYVAGHYSQIDLRGVGSTTPTPVTPTFSSTAYEVGGKWTPGTWVFMGTAYSGRGMGQIFGDLAQFGDIKDTGGFVQIGDHFTPNWSAYAFYGMSKPDSTDVIRWMGNGSAGRLRSRQSALSLQYTQGPYDLGVEFMHANLDSTTNGVNRQSTSGNQLSLSALWHF